MIYGVIGNYGWAVVVFTLLIRVVLLPLDIKSKKSMKRMNSVQPQINALKGAQGQYEGWKRIVETRVGDKCAEAYLSRVAAATGTP